MKTALFDLDGTLIDSRADLATAVNLTRADFGLPPRPVEAIVACVGEGVRRLIEWTIPEQPAPLAVLLARQEAHYAAHCLDQTRLYADVAGTLDALCASGWRLAVVTNKPSRFVRCILDGLGVLNRFQTLVGGGDAPRLKPDPAPLLLAASRMGLVLDGADWMVGDHFTDLVAGHGAGVKCCFCRFGFGAARGEPEDAAIDRMADLHLVLHGR